MAKYTIGDIFQGDFPISQRYGERPEYYKQFGLAGHEGVDFATPVGTPVVAPFNGVILRDSVDKDYGNYLVIWDPVQKCAVWYCHLSNTQVQTGQQVTRGQVVGHTGNTGNSTGPHLHVNFVETDSSGNRLNTKNGFQGFLNILDPNLVSWNLGDGNTPPPPPPPPPPPDDTTEDPQYSQLVVQIKSILNGPFGDKEKIDAVKGLLEQANI